MVRIKATNVQHVKLFDFIQQSFQAFGARFQCLPESKLKVIHQADAGRNKSAVGETMQEFHAQFKVRKDERAVLLGFRNLVDPDHRFGDETQVAFVAKEETLRLHAHGGSRHRLDLLEHAFGCDHGDVFNDLFDIAVAVLFHTAGVGRDPATQGGEFYAVRFVAGSEPILAQLFFKLHPGDACLHRGPQIFSVDPLDLIHALHVH